jgi:hypothetical protein
MRKEIALQPHDPLVQTIGLGANREALPRYNLRYIDLKGRQIRACNATSNNYVAHIIHTGIKMSEAIMHLSKLRLPIASGLIQHPYKDRNSQSVYDCECYNDPLKHSHLTGQAESFSV